MVRKHKNYLYIYKTTNLINGKIYVGQRGCDCKPELDTNYLGSGRIIRAAIKKYGKENFKKEILEITDKVNLDRREIDLIALNKANVKLDGYNLRSGGSKESKHAEETIELIGKKTRERCKNPEYIKKLRVANKKAQSRPEVKEKRKKTFETEEFKKKHREGVKRGKLKYDTSAAAKKNWTKDRRTKTSKWNRFYKKSEALKRGKLESLPKRELIKCPYCEVQSYDAGNMSRWHFGNCKSLDIVESVEYLDEIPDYVYNLKIKDNHNYFVNGILTHNCDDPQDPNMASSDVERRNVIDFYSGTLYSRLNDPDIGVRIVIQQRLAELDLTGFLMHPKVGRPEDHLHICIPATYSEKVVNPPELKDYYQDGLFWPSRFHRVALAQFKKTLGGLQYAGQVEQLPAPLEGNLVKRDWFEIKKANLVSRNFDKEPIVFFLDTAYTEKQANDPSAVLAAFKRDTKVYLINAAEVRMIFPDLVPFVQEFVRINGYSRRGSMIWVEPKASGKSLVQTLRAVSDLNVGEIVSDLVNGKDKTGRLSSISPYIQSGKVVLVEGQWNDHFLTQVCSFPNASHDEFVDLLSYCVDEMLVRGDCTLGG